MILPPYFGINTVYDEDEIKQIILSYLSNDILTFTDPKAIAALTYLSMDCLTHEQAKSISSVTFLGLDAVSLPTLSTDLAITYHAADICTYDPPPAPPEITEFLTSSIGDSEIEFYWSSPYNNRCDITEYILQYTDCFLSQMLAENSDTIISEDSDILIGEQYRDNCEYQEYNRQKILTQTKDRLKANTSLFITEQSSGIGTVNNITVTDLINDQPHIFRIAAVNCAGTGEFSTTGILYPISIFHKYCDIKLFMQPNSTTDIQASLQDYSCREKDINYLAGVSVSSESQFGAGSLYFNGQLDYPPSPATYSHLRIDNNSGTTGEDWSIDNDFTIELWVRPNNSSSSDTIMSAYSQQDPEYNIANNNYWKLTRTSNSVVFNIEKSESISSDSLTLTASGTTLPTGEFTHVAISRLQGNARLYINGVLKDKEYSNISTYIDSQFLIVGANQGNNYDNSDTFNIGRGAVSNPFIGHIDDIMISKSARYGKTLFIPEKYSEPADCDGCGGYTLAASSNTISNEFIP
jgi:hypothetical protein